jgi:hypothetical protein
MVAASLKMLEVVAASWIRNLTAGIERSVCGVITVSVSNFEFWEYQIAAAENRTSSSSLKHVFKTQRSLEESLDIVEFPS